MTEKELTCARELKTRIRALEWRLQTLREDAAQLVPILDGLPHAQTQKSRIEELAVKIIAVEEEIATLKEKFVQAAFELDEKIESSTLDALERAVINLRYVACMNFLDIQGSLQISDATVFYVHRNARKKILNLIKDISS